MNCGLLLRPAALGLMAWALAPGGWAQVNTGAAPAAAPAASVPAAAASVPAAAASASAATAPMASASAPRTPMAAASSPGTPSMAAPAAAKKPVSQASRRAQAKPRTVPARALAAAPASLAPASLVTPALPEHERQLQAIRQALLEATLAAPVRVQSTSWIDADGRLHEDTQYTSDARVRGVRILSYLDEPVTGEPAKVRVDTRVLPPGVRPTAGEDPQQCLSEQGRWRQALHVEVDAGPGLDQSTAGSAQLIENTRQAFLTAARQSRRWASQARPYQPTSSYERALLGRDADQADWLIRVALQRSSTGLEAVLELRPQQRNGVPRLWRLPVAGLTLPDTAAWHALVAQWVAALDQQTACDPVWFAVAGGAGAWRLREGEAHGLRAGDRLLVVDRQHLAGRSLEPGAAPSVALVQVVSTSSRGTALQWLAGPRPPTAGDWVALPL